MFHTLLSCDSPGSMECMYVENAAAATGTFCSFLVTVTRIFYSIL